MENKFLNETGLSRFFNNIKNIFAPTSHSHTKSEITDFPDVPTKTSELENDDGFISKAIIDVVELPTENINENVSYRLLTGTFLMNRIHIFPCRCVEILPEVGDPFLNEDMTTMVAYYNVQDGAVYGYVENTLSESLGIAVGWYDIGTLFAYFDIPYGGVIADIMDDPMDDVARLLLEYVKWEYKDGWTSPKLIGMAGDASDAEIFNGLSNKAYGIASHAEGSNTVAEGESSHAEGESSHAEGESSHAEGESSHAEGESSHAEGLNTVAEGLSSHAEGQSSHAKGNSSHAEGCMTVAEGLFSHAEGRSSHAEGDFSHAEGESSHAEGESSHAEGYKSYAKGVSSHAEGDNSDAEGDNSHAEGYQSHAEGKYSHAEGYQSHAEGKYSHAEGYQSHAKGVFSHVEGNASRAEGQSSHAEGIGSYAKGDNSHAEGEHSHAEGESSHAEGSNTIAEGEHSHAEGYLSHAEGYLSHAEGRGGIITKYITGASNATTYTVDSVGNIIVGAFVRYGNSTDTYNTAKIISIDEVNSTITLNRTLSDVDLNNQFVYIYIAGMALGDYSHSEGNGTIASGRSQHTQGEFNIVDPEYNVYDNSARGKYAHIVGNGIDENNRSNAHTIDWYGVGWYKGGLKIGGNGQDDGAQTVMVNGDKEIVLTSSAAGSAKRFKITVDDNGELIVAEIA